MEPPDQTPISSSKRKRKPSPQPDSDEPCKTIASVPVSVKKEKESENIPYLGSTTPEVIPLKKRRGRPPGRKNNKTILNDMKKQELQRLMGQGKMTQANVNADTFIKTEKFDVPLNPNLSLQPSLTGSAISQLSKLPFFKNSFPQTSQQDAEPEWKAYAYKYKPKVYSCEVCKEKFNSAFSYKQHELIHLELEPGQIPGDQLLLKQFRCDPCNKDFKHKPDLDAHNYYSHWREEVVSSTN